jgi:hypothetical protein
VTEMKSGHAHLIAGGFPPGLGIAAVATAGYGGLLAGPPLIGTVAELIGLRLALTTILLGALAIATFAGLARNRTVRGLPSLD